MAEETKELVIASEATQELQLTLAAIETTKHNIALCEQLVREVLEPNIDFGKTPGIEQPYLWDSGAAKIMAAFNAYPTYQILESTDTDRKTAFTICSELINRHTKDIIATGIGSASTTEKKYRYLRKDPDAEAEGIPNTILKMAAKRADVDAVHSLPGVAATLRKVFTTGLPQPLAENWRLFYAKLKNLGIDINQARAILGISSFKTDWIETQHKTAEEAYEAIKAYLTAHPPPKEPVHDAKA